MPKITAQARLARRQDFIDAAWRLLARSGWRDLTIDDICAEAAASKGAFYGHFDRKQDLLLALMDDEATAMEALFTEAAQQPPGGRRLLWLARAMLQRAADPARVQLRADLWAALAGEPTTRQRLSAMITRQRVEVRKLIQEGTGGSQIAGAPANALASILLALTEGLVLHGSLDPRAFRWANVQQALDVVLDSTQP